jgi:hypothetical protein
MPPGQKGLRVVRRGPLTCSYGRPRIFVREGVSTVAGKAAQQAIQAQHAQHTVHKAVQQRLQASEQVFVRCR